MHAYLNRNAFAVLLVSVLLTGGACQKAEDMAESTGLYETPESQVEAVTLTAGYIGSLILNVKAAKDAGLLSPEKVAVLKGYLTSANHACQSALDSLESNPDAEVDDILALTKTAISTVLGIMADSGAEVAPVPPKSLTAEASQ